MRGLLLVSVQAVANHAAAQAAIQKQHEAAVAAAKAEHAAAVAAAEEQWQQQQVQSEHAYQLQLKQAQQEHAELVQQVRLRCTVRVAFCGSEGAQVCCFRWQVMLGCKMPPC